MAWWLCWVFAVLLLGGELRGNFLPFVEDPVLSVPSAEGEARYYGESVRPGDVPVRVTGD